MKLLLAIAAIIIGGVIAAFLYVAHIASAWKGSGERDDSESFYDN